MSRTEFNVDGLYENINQILKIEKSYPKEANKFINNVLGKCKAEVIARTPVRKKGKSKKTKKKWKHKVHKRGDRHFGVLSNSSENIYLIENGHVAQNGRWIEGAHMLENTITNKQPWIDREIEKFVDKMLDV